ncbi:MAG TPA: ATP-binding cassette domain-containing protein, partial [Verrucomicrobiae bacterium]|nr:ATP-binding cassette domain-containing protein [Verrucomicrobiae bacterium]
EHIRKDFGSVCAVRDVSFVIPEGTTYGLIGPNGAGKTTTMRAILGILAVDAGRIAWKGTAVDGRMRRRFGYLPEERGLYGRMSVIEQIDYFAQLHGLRGGEGKRRAREWIARLELEGYADRPCSELSKGNQQKVQIACAAVHAPELLVLDEPFSGLDPVNAEILLAILQGLKADGTTLVLSSHQMWQLEVLCTGFCIVSGGRNRLAGTLAELRARMPARVVRAAPSSEAVRNVLGAVPGARPVESEPGVAAYEVPAATDFAAVLSRLVAADAIVRFEAVEPSLREIYLAAVGEAA